MLQVNIHEAKTHLSRLINHPRLKEATFIMETPKVSDDDDRRNIETARDMLRNGNYGKRKTVSV